MLFYLSIVFNAVFLTNTQGFTLCCYMSGRCPCYIFFEPVLKGQRVKA